MTLRILVYGLEINKNSICTAIKWCISSRIRRQLSRYCASTIMRPLTKCFSFKDYDVIGFDLDGTLLRYNLSEMVPLEYELLSRYLVQNKSYSDDILGYLDNPVDRDFLQKGLFLDVERGNVLKLDNKGYILKANHGTRTMNDEEIISIYGEKRQWFLAKEFVDNPLRAWEGSLAEKMRSLLDYFDISASLVFARAVDDVDCKQYTPNTPYKVWPDILEALIHFYTRDNFSNGKSEYFQKLKCDPDRFLLKTSPIVIDWLKDLKKSKKIFLLTGSNIDFADFTASYAIGKNWRDIFDVVICFAKKPGFFHALRPFYKIEDFMETESIAVDDDLKINSLYSMGNWTQLLSLFAKETCKDASTLKSLYIGDNLIQDVYAPSTLANIDCVVISEELLAENFQHTFQMYESFQFKDLVASNYWNSYFFQNGLPTLWTDIIAKYSKMCVPTIEHVACKPVDYEFLIDNEMGFYPSAPII